MFRLSESIAQAQSGDQTPSLVIKITYVICPLFIALDIEA
jgi:hypothetical protein